MSMIDELQRLLDDAGLEWRSCGDDGFVYRADEYVHFAWTDGERTFKVYRFNTDDGTLCIDGLTPEQAIAATLGAVEYRKPTTLSQLEAENAKLRELCKDMMAFVEDDDACERCGHDAECVEAADGELVLPYEGQCLMLDLFADRMCELGIEVDA